MKILNSLRFRITVALVAFATALAVLYGVAVWWGAVVAEDRVFHAKLTDEIDGWLQARLVDKNTPVPSARNVTSYLGRDQLPARLKNLITQSEGITEFKKENLYVAAQPVDGDVLYVVYDVSKIEVLENLEPQIYLSALVAGILAIAASLWLSRSLSTRVIAPVVSLADLFRDRKPNALPKQFASDYYDDEIGFLARTLEQQVTRIEDFVEHEVRFSRDASHELRTPVTSIKLALDVMEASSDAQSPGLAKPLARIRRANSDMEHLINTLLWLSRERRKLERAGPVVGPVERTVSVVTECVDVHRTMAEVKNVGIRVIDETTRPLELHRDLFSIAVSNLVRNAFSYTDEGEVKVILTDDRVSVIDTGLGLSTDDGAAPKGYGFGLELVRRICYRCGWELEMTDASPVGTNATLRFG